jgi:hypothetical protein
VATRKCAKCKKEIYSSEYRVGDICIDCFQEYVDKCKTIFDVFPITNSDLGVVTFEPHEFMSIMDAIKFDFNTLMFRIDQKDLAEDSQIMLLHVIDDREFMFVNAINATGEVFIAKNKHLPIMYDLYQGLATCPHCDQSIEIRNPTGYCDHLNYPDNCEVCKKLYTK